MIKLLHRILHLPYRVCVYFYYKHKMGLFYWSSYIGKPLRIDGGKSIYVGKDVSIKYRSWIASTPLTGEGKSQLVFEDGCVIGHFNHIFATKSIILHKNVLTADKVYISDNLHGYEDTEIPIKNQPVVQNGTVEIGEGSWLGENVCVVGANSVVTRDIPDYSVAVGSPARVIKKIDFNENKWKKIDGGGGNPSYSQNMLLLVA